MRDIENLEIELLLEGIFQRYGIDFRGHVREPLRRKLREYMHGNGLTTVSALQESVLHDAGAGERLMRSLSARPAALYDDAAHFRALRDVLGSWLRSSPAPRIWIAECAAAEDVFGLAILLHEEGLLERTQLYATSANESLLADAARGRIAAARIADYEAGYRAAGGRKSLSDYLVRDGDEAAFLPELSAGVTWSQYNLATDASFNEFELILCREPLAEFGPALRRRALHLFHDSLARFGILSLPALEDAASEPLLAGYTSVLRQPGLYRRVL